MWFQSFVFCLVEIEKRIYILPVPIRYKIVELLRLRQIIAQRIAVKRVALFETPLFVSYFDKNAKNNPSFERENKSRDNDNKDAIEEDMRAVVAPNITKYFIPSKCLVTNALNAIIKTSIDWKVFCLTSSKGTVGSSSENGTNNVTAIEIVKHVINPSKNVKLIADEMIRFLSKDSADRHPIMSYPLNAKKQMEAPEKVFKMKKSINNLLKSTLTSFKTILLFNIQMDLRATLILIICFHK